MKIAISSCLLGNKVRYDGQDKCNKFITNLLAKYATFIPFCPEDLAFGTPRESMRLVDANGKIRVVSNKDSKDFTAKLQECIKAEIVRIQKEDICAIIFKSKSPSCGFKSAKLYLPNGHPIDKTDGVFTFTCKEYFSHLPMEEEARLIDPWLRENFIMHIFSLERFKKFQKEAKGFNELVLFHTKNKFLLQSKSEQLYRELGLIVANSKKLPFDEAVSNYEQIYKQTVKKMSSIQKTHNVLEHMAGFFKNCSSKGELALLRLMIEQYANNLVPLITPVSAILLLAHKYKIEYLLNQTFLQPYPKDLALRSSIEVGK